MHRHAAIIAVRAFAEIEASPSLRPLAALPRQQEANFLRNGIFLAAISANRKFLRNQVLDNQRTTRRRCLTPPCPCPHTAPARLAHASPVPLPAWQVSREALSVVRADEPRGRTTWTSEDCGTGFVRARKASSHSYHTCSATPPIAVETRRRSRDDNLFGDTTNCGGDPGGSPSSFGIVLYLKPWGHLATLARPREAGWLGIRVSPRGQSGPAV